MNESDLDSDSIKSVDPQCSSSVLDSQRLIINNSSLVRLYTIIGESGSENDPLKWLINHIFS